MTKKEWLATVRLINYHVRHMLGRDIYTRCWTEPRVHGQYRTKLGTYSHKKAIAVSNFINSHFNDIAMAFIEDNKVAEHRYEGTNVFYYPLIDITE